MSALADMLLAAPAFAACALSAFVALEVACAFLPERRAPARPPAAPARPPLAVVVPAHDEEAGLAPTLAGIRAALAPTDRLIVVADNCADRTADIAAAGGAEVLVRMDAARRGKGYALQFAIDHLKAAPPALVIFIDADCRIDPGALERLAEAALASGRPAQALYLLETPADAPPRRAVAAFAWLFINDVRMSGLWRLAGVTRLLGTGMAIPWAILERIDLGSGEIVEDLALTLRLAADGASPVFVRAARVESLFPPTDAGARAQRARWELGSLRAGAARAPRLIGAALRRGDFRGLAIGLDVAVPPLILFAGAQSAIFALALVLGAGLAAGLAATGLVLLFAAVAAAWAGFGRRALPVARLPALAAHAAEKFRVYGGEGRRSAQSWTRAERDAAAGDPK